MIKKLHGFKVHKLSCHLQKEKYEKRVFKNISKRVFRRSFSLLNVITTDAHTFLPSMNEIFHGFEVFVAKNLSITDSSHFLFQIMSIFEIAASELLFDSSKKEKVAWTEVRRIWRVFNYGDAEMRSEFLCPLGNVGCCVVMQQKNSS